MKSISLRFTQQGVNVCESIALKGYWFLNKTIIFIVVWALVHIKNC